ncbi:phosphoribosylaminoimidazolesuccinocarboxamide synthase [Allohahella marinimesophila]|uniref:Phosphoribosylaminoimidazole-succinocarboxamide synthase n=1 Tax=Allohahella marinimesophila TaxID=1054972 RepID=A0ABP7NP57_9GAMM
MALNKTEKLYSGKAKDIYATEDADLVIMHFRDDTSAFDGIRKEQLAEKGVINNSINAFVMTYLADKGIPVHFQKKLSDTDSLVRRLTMIPVESVVRNFAAGSLVKRLGLTEGLPLKPSTYELFVKNDELHDPMVNDSLVVTLNMASQAQLDEMKRLSLEVNSHLVELFAKASMTLVDFKLEFGVAGDGTLCLGDEFSPDGCRIWDSATGEKMDKDRFRQNLGQVVDYYKEVAGRLGVDLNQGPNPD